MSEKNIKKLLGKIYTNSSTLDEWLHNPQEKTKEWVPELDATTVDSLKTTIQYISQELQQIQEVRYVTQHTVKKINQASRHAIFSFYSSLILHIVAFFVGIILLMLGVYAFFSDRTMLGFILSTVGMVGVGYFLIVKPFQELNENIENLIQMEVALGSWFNEMTYWQVFVRDTQLEEKQIVAQAMRDAAKWAIMLIEDYSNKAKKEKLDGDRYESLMARTQSLFEKLRSKPPEKTAPTDRLLTKPTETKQSTPATTTKPETQPVSNPATPEEKKI